MALWYTSRTYEVAISVSRAPSTRTGSTLAARHSIFFSEGMKCLFLIRVPRHFLLLVVEIGLVFLRWILFRVVFTTGALKLLGGDGDWCVYKFW